MFLSHSTIIIARPPGLMDEPDGVPAQLGRGNSRGGACGTNVRRQPASSKIRRLTLLNPQQARFGDGHGRRSTCQHAIARRCDGQHAERLDHRRCTLVLFTTTSDDPGTILMRVEFAQLADALAFKASFGAAESQAPAAAA